MIRAERCVKGRRALTPQASRPRRRLRRERDRPLPFRAPRRAARRRGERLGRGALLVGHAVSRRRHEARAKRGQAKAGSGEPRASQGQGVHDEIVLRVGSRRRSFMLLSEWHVEFARDVDNILGDMASKYRPLKKDAASLKPSPGRMLPRLYQFSRVHTTHDTSTRRIAHTPTRLAGSNAPSFVLLRLASPYGARYDNTRRTPTHLAGSSGRSAGGSGIAADASRARRPCAAATRTHAPTVIHAGAKTSAHLEIETTCRVRNYLPQTLACNRP